MPLTVLIDENKKQASIYSDIVKIKRKKKEKIKLHYQTSITHACPTYFLMFMSNSVYLCLNFDLIRQTFTLNKDVKLF